MLVDENGSRITTLRGCSVTRLERKDLLAILNFIKGAVRAFCKNGDPNNGKYVTFELRDLFGGVNFDWDKTPMQELYNKYYNPNAFDPNKAAIAEAGKAAGRLLKRILFEEEGRKYKPCDAGKANGYTWIE